MNKKRRLKKPFRMLLLIILVFNVAFVIKAFYKEFTINSKTDDEQSALEIKKQKDALYLTCMEAGFKEEELTDLIKESILEVNDYIKSNNYDISFNYQDITTQFTFGHNINKTYYGASLIKALESLYLYEKASLGEVDLDEKIKYTSSDQRAYSTDMEKMSYGSMHKIRNLISYSLLHSDNSAHFMLVDYIGKTNLKNFGLSLGAKKTLLGTDTYGYTDAFDSTVYMLKINDFITNNEMLGQEFKKNMVDSKENVLKIDEYEVAHKYGLHNGNYHNMGIIYTNKPYTLVVLSYGITNKNKVFNDIASLIRETHNSFYEQRKSNCLKVYDN